MIRDISSQAGDLVGDSKNSDLDIDSSVRDELIADFPKLGCERANLIGVSS
jgi:hypothetical protein